MLLNLLKVEATINRRDDGMEETYQALRKPATQAMNMLALGSILLVLYNILLVSLLAATANYLIIATSIELLIIFCGLLQLFFPKILVIEKDKKESPDIYDSGHTFYI